MGKQLRLSKIILINVWFACIHFHEARSNWSVQHTAVISSLKNSVVNVNNELQFINRSLIFYEVGVNELSGATQQFVSLWNDCASLYEDGYTESGVYSIWLTTGYRFLPIYCDMETRHSDTNKRGWMVIQRRYNGELNFNRTWQEYVDGFGSPHGEYWIGLENIYQLASYSTEYSYYSRKRSLIIDLADNRKTYIRVDYEGFEIRNSSFAYMFARSAKTSSNPTVADGLLASHWTKFTTYDRNNQDANHFGNCAQTSGGGWWVDFTCGWANLNARYPKKNEKMSKLTIYWEDWNELNPNNDALTNVSMKIQ